MHFRKFLKNCKILQIFLLRSKDDFQKLKKFDHMHPMLKKHRWGHFSQKFFTVREGILTLNTLQKVSSKHLH